MSYPVSPSPTTPADSPKWDEYRRVLALSGISVNDFPAHVPSAAPDYDPALDAADELMELRVAEGPSANGEDGAFCRACLARLKKCDCTREDVAEWLQQRIDACIREPEVSPAIEPEIPTLAETIRDRDEERAEFVRRAHDLLMSAYSLHQETGRLLDTVTDGPSGNWCRSTRGQLLYAGFSALSLAAHSLRLAADAGRDGK